MILGIPSTQSSSFASGGCRLNHRDAHRKLLTSVLTSLHGHARPIDPLCLCPVCSDPAPSPGRANLLAYLLFFTLSRGSTDGFTEIVREPRDAG